MVYWCMRRLYMDIVRIHGVIKDYDWGSRDFLPSLFGYSANGKPQAEAWFGTHPLGEATLDDGSKLSDLITADPDAMLGKERVAVFGPHLPLLLKVLAIQKPLSIQCHPDKEQAKQGWAKEEEYRKTAPVSEWDYKDDNQKAEVLFALTPTTAMCGFRPFDAIVEHLKRLIPNAWENYFTACQNIDTLFKTLYSLPKKDLKVLIAEYIKNLEENDEEFCKGQFLTEKGIALSCYKAYPLDPGLLCPYLLNVVFLRTGEAIYLRPRVLHAYVRGNGIELMSASDNVLRGGLTMKKVDLPELLSVMEAQAGSGDKSEERSDEFGRLVVETPTDEFRLVVAQSGMYEIREKVPSVALVSEGRCRISLGGEHIDLMQGEAAFIPYCVDSYLLKVRGKIFFAQVPEVKR